MLDHIILALRFVHFVFAAVVLGLTSRGVRPTSMMRATDID